MEEFELTQNDPAPVDEAMLQVNEFITEMTDLEAYMLSPDQDFAMKVKSIFIDMPLQLDLHVQEDGQVKLGSSPPLYYVETTVMPVFHQIKVNIEIDHEY